MANTMRSFYIVTLAHSERSDLTDKAAFGRAVAEGFEAMHGKRAVVEWACAEEQHQDQGAHYHCLIKLRRTFRWLPVKKFLHERHSVQVNFSGGEGGDYRGAYAYITKEDGQVARSEGFQVVEDAPRTQSATRARMQRGGSSSRRRGGVSRFIAQGLPGEEFPEQREKVKKLTRMEVSQLVKENSVTTMTELMVLAKRMELAGDDLLVQFIVNNGQHRCEELVALTVELSKCIEDQLQSQRSRLDKLRDALQIPCSCSPQGQWKSLAQGTLESNNIGCKEFCQAVVTNLKIGRGKGRNLFLVGRANCGKSFLLRPLQKIFNTLTNPASNSFSFAEVVKNEVILLDDYRYNRGKPLAWKDLLLLLDGATLHFSQPRNHFFSDVCLADTNTIPFFATGKGLPEYVDEAGKGDKMEDEMARVRFKIFLCFKSRAGAEVKECLPCGRCFAEFVMEHGGNRVSVTLRLCSICSCKKVVLSSSWEWGWGCLRVLGHSVKHLT